MTKQEFDATLRTVGAKIVVHEAFPPGPGIFENEVGGEGPWYGILFEHGYTYGWVREIEALYDAEIFARHVGALVAIRRLAEALSAARARAMYEAAERVRNLRPKECCTCGGYLSFRNGVPGHVAGCPVGEYLEVADEIDAMGEETLASADLAALEEGK